jgi:hypothetical protein
MQLQSAPVSDGGTALNIWRPEGRVWLSDDDQSPVEELTEYLSSDEWFEFKNRLARQEPH